MSMNGFQARPSLLLGFLTTLLWGCGGDEPVLEGGPITTAGATAPAAGAPAMAGAGSPAAGTTAPRPAGSGAGGRTATAGAPAAGAGGVGGVVPAAGSGGVAGSAAGGTGGVGGTAGAGGAAGGAAPAGDALVRGEAPTMATAMAEGPYGVESYTDGFADGDEYLAGTIYYPTDAEPPFAAVVACPGFTAYQDSVAPWGPFLGSHGIVVMTIDTNTTSDSVDIRQGALLDALNSLKGEQTREGSPLKGKLHMTRFGLMGWSMGGGGTWLNAKDHPELKSGITLAGHIVTQAGGAGQFTTVTVPVLMLAGNADTDILGLGMSQPVYESIPESTPKMLYEVDGASHFDISPDIGGGLFGLFGLSWQKTFLEGDERYRQFLSLPMPDNASDYRTNVK